MELLLNRDQVMKGVETAKAFAESATGLRVLQHAHVSAGFGKLRLTTTDLSLWCQVELKAETLNPGTALVPVKALGKVLKNLPQSRFSMCKDGEELVFAAGNSEIRVAGMEPDDYPEINMPEGRLLSMPLRASMVNDVAYAVSKDETRYTLCGVLMLVSGGRMKLLGTNGNRLSRVQCPLPPGSEVEQVDGEIKAIVPVRLLIEGVRLARQLGTPAILEVYEKAAAVRLNGSMTIWAGLIEGEYPDYEGCLPAEYAGSVAVPHGALVSAVGRLLNLSKGIRNPGVRLGMVQSHLEMRLLEVSDGVTSAVERVTTTRVTGTVPVLGVDVKYLSDALVRLSDSVWVQLMFSDGEGARPMALQSFESGGDRLLGVIMPRKL